MLTSDASAGLALNSLPFLAFLALTVGAFFVAPRRWRWLLVVAASGVFYGGWETTPALLGAVAMVTVAYGSARAMVRWPARRRWAAAVGLAASLGILVLLKYLDFLVAEAYGLAARLDLVAGGAPPEGAPWYLPVGYSFLTFSLASYVIDVYRGVMAPAGWRELTVWATFFPKLLAGPIERAAHFLPQWRRRLRLDWRNVGEGAELVLWGLFKKVVIADRLATFVDPAYANPAFATPVELLVATYFYAFQIYCDFSGYSDIAIGACKAFGLDLAANFRQPYLSRSVGEFWARRWHISLATWFRDYLYIPLGGSRVPRWRHYLNLMTVFVVSGLWHAGLSGLAVNWTFALWGAINGGYQVVSVAAAPAFAWLGRRWAWLRRLPERPGVAFLQAVGVFHLVAFTWIFFRASSIADAWTVITRIGTNLSSLPMLARFYDVQNFDFLASLALIVGLLVAEGFYARKPLLHRLRDAPRPLRWAHAYLLGLALIVLGRWGTSEFIYMQF